MLENVYDRLLPYAKSKYILMGIGVIFLFNVVFLPQFPKLVAGVELPVEEIIDVKFSYSPQEAYDVIEAFSADQRAAYWKSELFVDNTYALVYGITYTLLLIFLFSRAFAGNRFLQKVALLPLLATFADWVENACIINMVLIFPERNDSLMGMSSMFTSMKWILAGIMIGLIMVSGAKMMMNRGQN